MTLEDSFGRESNSPPPAKPMLRSVFSAFGRMKLCSRHVLNHLFPLLPPPTTLEAPVSLHSILQMHQLPTPFSPFVTPNILLRLYFYSNIFYASILSLINLLISCLPYACYTSSLLLLLLLLFWFLDLFAFLYDY